MAEQTKSVRFPKALNSEGGEIHILDAERGRKGYYCTGCKKEAEAVKPKLGNIQAYFRHAATDVLVEQSECTWSSETYRHRIAKDVLQRIKYIKVPRLLNFPPKGSDGDPDCPDRLKTWFRQENFYLITQQRSQLSKDTDQLSGSLKRKLSNLGVTQEELFDLMRKGGHY